MTFLQHLADALTDAVVRTGPAAPVVLCFGTFVEYVFPPFPGDLVVVLGAWYAVHGELSWPATFASAMVGAVAGAWVDYRIGAAVRRGADRRAARGGRLTGVRLARFEERYRRFGGLLLVVNRFFPGIRAFLFVAAGASGIPLRKVLVLGAVSAALWNGLLLAAGALLARNVEQLIALVERYTVLAYVAMAVAAAAAAVVLLVRRRLAAIRPEGR